MGSLQCVGGQATQTSGNWGQGRRPLINSRAVQAPPCPCVLQETAVPLDAGVALYRSTLFWVGGTHRRYFQKLRGTTGPPSSACQLLPSPSTSSRPGVAYTFLPTKFFPAPLHVPPDISFC